jgi:hypothetical protein
MNQTDRRENPGSLQWGKGGLSIKGAEATGYPHMGENKT